MKSCLLFLILFSSTLSFAQSTPKLFFEYGIFDMSCRPDAEKPITPAMEKELKERIPSLQKLWDSKGEKPMAATVDLFKLGFQRKEETAVLFLCPWFPPMSSPLMIRMREFLKSSAKEQRPDFYFVALVYHEMLHRYLDTNFDHFMNEQKSPLFKKYSKENEGVLAHIHLLAVLKSVYTDMKQTDELKNIIEWDSQIPGPVYKRSWEIVNTEGYEKFIAELKAAK